MCISVIIPAFNAEKTLDRAIRSVLTQSLPADEILVVDDASTDRTAQIVEGYSSTQKVQRIQHLQQRGAAAARNTGIDETNGELIAFLDADDAWLPDKLGEQFEALNQSRADLCYTGFTRIQGTKRHIVKVPKTVDYGTLLNGNVICCSSVMLFRSALGHQKFPDLKYRQDFALWLMLLVDKRKAVGVQAPLVDLHVTPGSLSSPRLKTMHATYQVYRRERELTSLRALYHLGRHLTGRLIRG